ncbi:DUF3099 domain-containing protein [Paenarthrobacter nicotinovorans]|uniref:DUF3099 domain-containing protein n=1 Tax=Paenarthrobacter nicotinovorans TaxID=29320 RepID=A0ABV0GXU7_PAENI|nr:DUF3099 domain-containing protein [Paenarthrobacter nicotinovorans]
MERDDSVVTRENSPLQQVPGEPDAFSGEPEVHSITDAAAAHSEDMRERMIKYAVAMGIRMVCIILIFVVDGWFKIIAIAGAVFLPWIAVVIANGNDKAEDHSESLLDYVAVPEIERSSPSEEPAAEGPEVLQGELVDDEPSWQQDGPPTGPASEAGHTGDERAAS